MMVGTIVYFRVKLGAYDVNITAATIAVSPRQDCSPMIKQVFLGLLKGFGAGSLSTGVAVTLLALYPLRLKQGWAYLVTPLVSASFIVALTYVTTFALLPGAVPIVISKVFLGLVLLASIASFFRSRA